MAKKETKMLTVKEVSNQIGAPLSTVRLWAQQGRFPGAELTVSPVGSYWLIPNTALTDFKKPERGRPPKPKAEAKKGKSK
jgi:excisionase family DNA binding protein